VSPELRRFIDAVVIPNLLELWRREQVEASRPADDTLGRGIAEEGRDERTTEEVRP
jgi:hypothetical protein